LAGEFAHQGLLQLLTFISFLLLFLGYINLLPLPPLDGGHLLVLGVEAVSSKEIDMRKLYPVAVVVIAIFALLFILTLRLDIINPIKLP
jgi:regulator of sigma E protease